MDVVVVDVNLIVDLLGVDVSLSLLPLEYERDINPFVLLLFDVIPDSITTAEFVLEVAEFVKC